MKFHKRPKYGGFQDTSRKRANVTRKQQAERDALPLFADEIAQAQPSVDAVMKSRADEWRDSEQRERDTLARSWRTLRREIAALPVHQRDQIKSRAAVYGGQLNLVAYSYFYRETTGHHRPSLTPSKTVKPTLKP